MGTVRRIDQLMDWGSLGCLLLLVLGSQVVRPAADDFGQYYMAGRMALIGGGADLYPIPKATSVLNPGGTTESEMRPRYASEAARCGVGDANRFMQPPPAAVLLMPLGLMPYRVAFYLWLVGVLICGWGIGRMAARFHDLCAGGPAGGTRSGRWLVALVTLSPLMYRTGRIAQISPIIGLCLAIAVHDLMRWRARGVRAGIVNVVASAGKYASVALAPLILIMRRWRMLAWSLAFGAVLFAASVCVMGTDPFRVFVREIAPTLVRTHGWRGNQSFQAMWLRIADSPTLPRGAQAALGTAQWATLAGVVWLMLRVPRSAWQLPPTVLASASILIIWLLVFSPIFWEHYYVYLCPFWGWLVWEAGGAGRRRWQFWAAAASIGLTWVPFCVVKGIPLREPFVSHMLVGALLMGAVAIGRLWRARKLRGDSPQASNEGNAPLDSRAHADA